MAPYRNLNAWKHAQRLAVECAKLARRLPPYEQEALACELRRSPYHRPISIADGIARRGSDGRRAGLGPAPAAAAANRLRFAGWTLDLAHRQLISSDGVVVALSGGEYRLLKGFLGHPNRVLNRDQLLDLTRGRESTPFDRSIDVQVGRLRRRLGDTGQEPSLIKTVRGEGYVLAAKVEEQT